MHTPHGDYKHSGESIIIINVNQQYKELRKGGEIYMKRHKLCLAIVLAVVLLGTLLASAAFARTNYPLTMNYITAMESKNGLNKNVTIKCYNGSPLHTNDIIMYGKTGNLVWQENGAIKANGQRTFWCGSNVYRVAVKTRSTSILGYLIPPAGSFDVW
jgi:hypothetical protein